MNCTTTVSPVWLKSTALGRRPPETQLCAFIKSAAEAAVESASAGSSWLTKLKGDQRAAKADLGLIVSHALPKDIDTFGYMDGVWVTSPKCAVPVAISLRESLILMSGVRAAGEGQQTKSALMYEYLTGPRFRHRIEAIVERFSEMQDDLASERKATMKRWSKREQQLHAVLDSTAGLYGDLQGIAGKSMIEIEALETPLLETLAEDD